MQIRMQDPGLARVRAQLDARGIRGATAGAQLFATAVADGELTRTEWMDLERVMGAPVASPVDRTAQEVLATSLYGMGRRPDLAFSEGVARGPEEPARVGDVVRSPPIPLLPEQVLRRADELTGVWRSNPGYLRQLQRAPFPETTAERLDWAIAQLPASVKTQDPLWTTGTNDSAAGWVAYVNGLLEARTVGFRVSTELEAEIAQAYAEALTSLRPGAPARPMPASAREQLRWAAELCLTSWDPGALPEVQSNLRARAVVDLVSGVLAKQSAALENVEVLAERRTLDVDGDTRVYAIHTPEGPRPEAGWPTVLFFHGSYGGYAPEQMPEYQALNAFADLHGFQVLYPVGTPQDRSDALRTGRGMLNWDPLGAGPGEKNDRFVFELLKELTRDGSVDASRVFVAGHSQGGYYVSDLLAAYPDAFAGAAIFGAGAGSVASATGFAHHSRRTPLLLNVGAQDIHIADAQRLSEKLRAEGYAEALHFKSPPNRGHEVLPEDYDELLRFFGAQAPYPESKVGLLDGRQRSQ